MFARTLIKIAIDKVFNRAIPRAFGTSNNSIGILTSGAYEISLIHVRLFIKYMTQK